MQLSPPAGLASVAVYRADPGRRTALLGAVVVLYAAAIQWAISTSGDPYAAAVEEARLMDSKKIEQESMTPKLVEVVEDEDHIGDIDDDPPARRKREPPAAQATPKAAASDAESDLPDLDIDEVEEEEEEDEFEDDDEDPGAAVRWARWREERQEARKEAAERRAAKAKAAQEAPRAAAAQQAPAEEDHTDGNKTDEHMQRPLPSTWLPSAGAAAMLFVLFCGHMLFHLMCHWNVAFRARALFSPAARLAEGCYVVIHPPPHRGKPDIARVARSAATQRLFFVFQRQRFEITETEDGSPPSVCPVLPVVDAEIRKYMKDPPLRQSAVADLSEHFGENQLQIAAPSVFVLWKSQMMSPIAVFQLFCTVLWMLDDYWTHSLMSLVMIMIFEGVTCMQRVRTLKQLSQMSMKSFRVQVCRDHRWELRETRELLPGDIISLRFVKHGGGSSGTVATTGAAAGAKDKPGAAAPAAPAPDANQGLCDLVPCDCLLLRGSAVINESTLTGESVPAMKDAIPPNEDLSRNLAMEGRDRVHTLFSGTTIVDSKPGEQEEGDPLPATPDGGCLCRVLRTGFGSSQGGLMQLIEFSTEGVASDSRETLIALLILLFFAIIAAVFVFRKGMAKGDRTTHELLIKAVLIVTSIVPRQLPMQMALAVNHALMSLMKQGIMCTEPYRVPLAGKITHCFFDKTGTLTTDTLVPAGVVNPGGKGGADVQPMVKVREAAPEAAMVLAGCHSLLHLEGQGIVGDPIELAALNGVEWRYDAAKQTARPGNWEAKEKGLKKLENELRGLDKNPERKKKVEKQLADAKQSIEEDRKRAERDKRSVAIVHRHHFSSQLQRMSVIARVEGAPAGSGGRLCALVKGSPEQLMTLFGKDTPPPPWFEPTYKHLMEEGSRVLALGYKWWDGGDPKRAQRGEVESNLRFAGFVAFSCRIRQDTTDVVLSLKDAHHEVCMVTGDGSLTALHVACRVGICDEALETLVLEPLPSGVGARWVPAKGEQGRSWPLVVGGGEDCMSSLSQYYSLMITEAAMQAALADPAVGEKLWDEIGVVKVFARMSPGGKGEVIRNLQERGKERGVHVLMCGDGGNDVGALKQADVGIALLCGYGNANTGEADEDADESLSPEERLNKTQEQMRKKSGEALNVRKELMGMKQKELMAKQQEWIVEEAKRLDPEGKGGIMVQMQAMKNVVQRVKDEMQKEGQEVQKIGNAYSPSIDDVLAQAEADTLLIRPGDASVAASFTCRLPSIRAAVDLIRQGRCTLLSALQQQQIMMLESLIQAFTYSALQSEGMRSSERQLIASGWLVSVASLAFSYASPIQRMHPQRPLRSLFHPAIFISMAGQAIIHILCMKCAVDMATEAMGEKELQAVIQFHRKVKLGEEVPENEDDPLASFWMAWQAPFKPNLLNTVTFLVENAQIVAVLFVNYKGRPWMKGVLENHALFLSVFLSFGATAFLAWEVSPTLNNLIHMAPFPDDDFRMKTCVLVLISFFGTLIWDRIVVYLAAPNVGKVMLEEAKRTRLVDLLPVATTFAKVVGGLAVLGSSNPLLWLACGYFYWKHKQQKKS
eukprot:TRINITY_DN14338_c0_g1_i1.p1 TRINITY_DN14338_c0_g1~~TRINITY_DN14338_c0_g1_i1.p1  ORF type:complete len:1561 (+),score=701.51 TRINITY_DN14338_c0_g1_i1:139-4821(+)